jgi:hypothetical protein
MHLADDGVAGGLAEQISNLARRKAIGPSLFQKIDAGIIPARTIARRRAGA